MAVLEGKKITKEFGGLTAVSEVDFVLNKGEILGLIGPNGAGKTTIINMISGTYPPTRGQVVFKGMDITGHKPYKIGRMGMTVKENVSVGAMFGALGKTLSSKQSIERAEEVLEFVGLEDMSNRRADDLNVASRKRLEIAKALAMGPEVILFDEVMAGLNFSEIDKAVELIQKVRDKGISILVIEHVMRAIKGVSDRIFVLHHGAKKADGISDDVLSDERVIKAYFRRRYKELVQ